MARLEERAFLIPFGFRKVDSGYENLLTRNKKMNKAKIFSTLTAVTVGAVAASGLFARPTLALADDHAAPAATTAAGEKSCSGDKGHDHHNCKDGHDKDGKACTDHPKGDKSCSGSKGEKSCGGSH